MSWEDWHDEADLDREAQAERKRNSFLLNNKLLAGTSQGIRNLLGIQKTMQIQILSVDIKTIPTAKGSYQAAEIAFKNLTYQGKVEGKKLMSFGAGADTFKTLSNAVSGNIFEITVVKNDKGFNDWTAATPSNGVASQPTPQAASTQVYQQGTGAIKGASTPVRSTYETPEERAKKQVYIVRQSSISNAVATLSAGAKSPPKVEEVITAAKQYEAFVFSQDEVEPDSFDDMEDEVL